MNRFETRRKKAQELMVKQEVAALQVTGRENYFYLTGDMRNVARLFLPQEGEPTIIVLMRKSRLQQKPQESRMLEAGERHRR